MTTPYYSDDAVTIWHGNALALPIPDESVDLIVTSPPYFGLRSYTDGGEHYDGQIGSEPTPREFVDALIAATAEMVRVLKPSGSIWVNLGDRYAGGGGQWDKDERDDPNGRRTSKSSGSARAAYTGGKTYGLKAKSLIGVPWRYAIRCIDELGLILRAEVIWSKCLSGGAVVYARVAGREKVITVKDLARCAPGTVELWTGEKWSPMLRCDPTPPTEGRSASSAAARQARYRGKPIPALAADLEIEFRNGERVGCTPNHKWPTARGIVRADELSIGDVVPTVQLPAGSAQVSGLDDELTGWLVGLYIAEGSRSEDMVQIASHVREHERFDRLQEIADAFDGRFALHHTGGNAATANLSGKVIRAVIDTYVGGRVAKDKRLAPACWRRSDTFLRAVLDGYLSGDGCYDTKGDFWRLNFTANDGLAADLRALGARLGYSVRLRRAVHHFDGRDFPGWSGSLYTDPARRKRPDGEIVTIRQSRARQFWNIEIADEPHEFALASGLLTENSNGLPESVTDRVRRSHETWFHFTKEPRYFSAVDEIRDPNYVREPRPNERLQLPGGGMQGQRNIPGRSDYGQTGSKPAEWNPLGKLPGSVWEVPTQPLKVPDHLGIDHFAAFPMEWPRRIIRGWSPTGVCVECGEGRRPVAAQVDEAHAAERARVRANRAKRTTREEGLAETFGGPGGRTNTGGFSDISNGVVRPSYAVTGYVCACNTPTAPTRPTVVLDPFGGTGTTALVAKALGRIGWHVDLSADYCRLAQWRVNDPAEIARAMQVEKPPAAPEDMDSLLDLLDIGGAA